MRHDAPAAPKAGRQAPRAALAASRAPGSWGGAGRGDAVGPHGLILVVSTLVTADLALIFLWVPTETLAMGVVQRIFYFHVPLAWVGFLAFGVVFVASILFLWRGGRRWDALAHASAEVGVVFTTLMLFSGSTWAKPVWGVWWTWDPRLTTSLILWLLYVAYLMVRAYAPTPAQAARYAAVLGTISFIDVPIVYFSVVWWRNIHPEIIVGPTAQPGSLEPEMLVTLLFSLLTFTLLFAYLLWERVRLREAEDAVRSLRGLERSE
ncbi:MAG: cytochrome c biogenesis protein CcsA [Chloroflexi bacterium]|nr:cytochrome c biogenesis protein CcsA [Chloroflexota bacterium]